MRPERRWRAGDANAPEHVKRMFQAPRQRDNAGEMRSDTAVTLPLQRAPVAVERSNIIEDERAIEIPVSSGDTLERQFWGFVYEEVLKHSADAVDLNMFNSSNAMILRDHDPRRPCGRIERAWLKDGRLWVRAVFPEGGPDLVEETWRGLSSDLFRNVSIGWSARPENVEVVENPRDAPEFDFRVIYHEWSPHETSIVSVPADWSVGVGRNLTVPITRTETMPQWLQNLLARYSAQINQRGFAVEQLGNDMTRAGINDEAGANDYLIRLFSGGDASQRATEPALEPAPRTSVPIVADPTQAGLAPASLAQASLSRTGPAPAIQTQLTHPAVDRSGARDPVGVSADPSGDQATALRQPDPAPAAVAQANLAQANLAQASLVMAGLRTVMNNETLLTRAGVSSDDFRTMQRSAMDNNWTQAQALESINGALEIRSPEVRQPGGPAIIHEQGNSYNLVRAMQALANGQRNDLSLPEMAVSAERQESWTRQLRRNEIFVPIRQLQQDQNFIRYMQREMVTRLRDARMIGDWATVQRMESMRGLGLGEHGGQRDVTVGATPAGLWVPDFDELAFIETLVAMSGILPLTDTWPEMLYQDLKIPAETGPAETGWTASETATLPKTTSPAYGNLEWAWREHYATFDASRRAHDQSMTLTMRLVQAIMRDMPRGIGRSMWDGTGATGQPTGILNFTGVDVIANGVNGGPPDYEMLVDMFTELGDNNALDLGQPYYFLNARTTGKLRKTQKFANASQGAVGSSNDTIVHNPTSPMPRVDGSTPIVMDNQLPANLTKGTGTNLSAGVGCIPAELRKAYFSDLIIGIDESTDWRGGQIRYYVRQACDFQPLHVGAFVTTVDINNT